MSIGYVVVAVLLSAVLAMSARGKLTKDERSVDVIHNKAKVPLSWFPLLAGLELLGAAGLLIGIAVVPIGIAAGVGLVLYFVGAVGAHLRAKDPMVLRPLFMLALAAVALALLA